MAMDSALVQSVARLYQQPVQVVVDPDGTPVELFVRGGVPFTFGRGLAEQETDILGVYDLISTGDSVEFTLRTEEQSQNVLNVLMSDMRDDDPYRGFGNTAGQSQRAHAQKIRIRPWQTRTSNANQIEIWKAVPSGDATLNTSPTDPWAWEQPFRGLPDLTQNDGTLLGRIKLDARA